MPPAPRPPRFARWLLRARPLGSRRAEVEADLEEVFVRRATAERDDFARASVTSSTCSASGAGTRPARGSFARPPRISRTGFACSAAVPGPVAITIGGLALAIGVSTAVFGLLNATLLMPLGVSDPDSARTRPPRLVGWRIARVGLRRLSRRCATCRATREWKRRGCCANPRGSLARRRRSTDTPQQVPVETVSGTFMDTFGAQAALRTSSGARRRDAGRAAGRRARLHVLGPPLRRGSRHRGPPGVAQRETGRDRRRDRAIVHRPDNYPPAFWMTFNGQRALGPRPRPDRVCRAAAGRRSPSWRGHRRR